VPSEAGPPVVKAIQPIWTISPRPKGGYHAYTESKILLNQPTYGGLPILFDGPTVLTKSIGCRKL
jgi:hypothetical protein